MNELDYDILSRKYVIDGVLVTKAKATQLLRNEGFSVRDARAVLGIHRRCAEREARLPPPVPDPMSEDEFWRLFRFTLFRTVNRCAARKWIAEHLRSTKRPYRLGLGTLKHRYERDGWARYIRKSDFADLLAAEGIRVVGDDVYCKEIRSQPLSARRTSCPTTLRNSRRSWPR